MTVGGGVGAIEFLKAAGAECNDGFFSWSITQMIEKNEFDVADCAVNTPEAACAATI